MALGQMGLNYDYFYSLTPRVFFNILHGWSERNEAESRERWEQTRQIAWFSWTVPGKNHNGFTMSKMMPFPWDNDGKPAFEATAMTPEEMAAEAAASNARWDERYRKLEAQKQQSQK